MMLPILLTREIFAEERKQKEEFDYSNDGKIDGFMKYYTKTGHKQRKHHFLNHMSQII